MNLVILADAWQPLTGGGQKLFQELTERLVKDHGFKIQVITRALKVKGKVYSQTEKLLNNKLSITRLGPPARWGNLLARFWFTIQSAFYLLRLKPDLFLASTFLPALSLKLVRVFKKTPQALVVIGLSGKDFFLEKLITQKLNFDLAITDDIAYFKQMKGKRNIKLIFNGVEIPKAKPVKKWGKFTYLFVGRNELRKGVPVLKSAFKKVNQKFPETKLRLIGPGFKLVSQDKLHQELLKAHCLVLPSLREGHPLILFEAWAHKLPVIATNVGSVSQFVNKQNGYLIESNNVDSLTQAMIKAYKSNQLNQMGESGYRMVKNQYTWKKTVSLYVEALKQV